MNINNIKLSFFASQMKSSSPLCTFDGCCTFFRYSRVVVAHLLIQYSMCRARSCMDVEYILRAVSSQSVSCSSIDLQYLLLMWCPSVLVYVCAYRSVLHVVVLASSHRQMRNWMVEIPKCMHYAGICCVATNLKYLINVHNAILFYMACREGQFEVVEVMS